MNLSHAKNNNRGFTLVEILVACTIITVTTFTLLSAAQKGVQLSNQGLSQTQATLLLEEGAEAVKSIRDANWSTISGLTVGTTYYLSYNTSSDTWSLTTTPSTIDSFTRTIVFSSVNRDSNDDIAATGTLDARTKEVTITVAWPAEDGRTLSKSLSLYIADIFN